MLQTSAHVKPFTQVSARIIMLVGPVYRPGKCGRPGSPCRCGAASSKIQVGTATTATKSRQKKSAALDPINVTTAELPSDAYATALSFEARLDGRFQSSGRGLSFPDARGSHNRKRYRS
jgi:hypothetical protein